MRCDVIGEDEGTHAGVVQVMPGAQQPPNLFWWWTETTHYLHRPTQKLGLFIEAQKARMGWRHPIIGIHMRLGVDKNREAQRFPTKYYMHEARRIRRLFSGGAQGDIGTIFVCSDRPRAVDKMIADYSSEFQILTQPRVEGALPMEYVHTDLSLLGEADYLIFTFSSNFGWPALLFCGCFPSALLPCWCLELWTTPPAPVIGGLPVVARACSPCLCSWAARPLVFLLDLPCSHVHVLTWGLALV